MRWLLPIYVHRPRDSSLRSGDSQRPSGTGANASWISDRDRRGDLERGAGNDRDRPPHPWDRDRPRDPDRPHPWDVNRGNQSHRMDQRRKVQSAVSRPGFENDEAEPHDSSRPVKRGGDDRDDEHGEDEWKSNKRRAVERDGEGTEAAREERRKEEPRRFQVADADEEGADLEERDEGDGGRGVRRERHVLSSVASAHRDADPSERRGRRGQDLQAERPEKPKLPLAENTEVKARNRKMFGTLLGHLQKAKKDEEKILQTPVMLKRVEIEEKVEVLARESGEVLRKKLAEEARAERRKNLEHIREVQTRSVAASPPHP